MSLPDPRYLSACTAVTCDRGTTPSDLVRWLANVESSELKMVVPKALGEAFEGNFPLNSQLRGFTETSDTSIRVTLSQPLPNARFGNSVAVKVPLGKNSTEVPVTDTAAAEQLNAQFDALYDSADPLDLDIPPWPTLLDQLTTTVGRRTRAEFERLIQAAQIESLGALDEVSVALIAAAQSGATMYDISEWGKEVGLGSKATFSRRKSGLEEDSIIYTTKVPVEVGRPRLRLHLSDDIEQVTLDEGKLDIGGTGGSVTSPVPDPDTLNHSSHKNDEQIEADTPSDGIIAAIEDEIEAAIRSH